MYNGVTVGGSGFVNKENDLLTSNALATGNPDSGTEAGAPARPGRDPFHILFYDQYLQNRLLAALKCPKPSVVVCIDGVLASVGVAQACGEACDGECCVGAGACNEFTVRVCGDSASCSGEGVCRNVGVVDVFLGCECTEAYYCVVDWDMMIRGWYWGASLSACGPRRLSTAGIHRRG